MHRSELILGVGENITALTGQISSQSLQCDLENVCLMQLSPSIKILPDKEKSNTSAILQRLTLLSREMLTFLSLSIHF